MHRKRLLSLALTTLLVLLGTVLLLLGESAPDIRPSLNQWAKNISLSDEKFWLILVAVVSLLVVIVKSIKHKFDSTGEPEQTNTYESKEEKDRRAFLTDLAGRYEKRYAHKLDKRYEISLWVSDEVEDTHSEQYDEEFGTDEHMSKATQYVIERFETRGRLLIVGSAGSGKTGLLLNLAKYLAEKALNDASQPLPVIFNLGSWSRGYASFSDWVTAMLTKGYGLSSDVAKRLQEEQLIVYLLDGLDELASNENPVCAAKARAECLASLYRFLHDGSMSAVICSRREEFDEMIWQTGTEPPVPVLMVHDLSPLRIDRALISASYTRRDKFAAPHLQAVLRADYGSIYYQVLSTPFYFTTALQVFDSTERPIIDAPDEDTLKSNLVAAFIQKKLEVTPNARHFPYSAAKTLGWLTWLAVFLKNEKSVTFELSDLQPSILGQTWLYRSLFSLFCGVFGGVVTGLYDWELVSGVVFGVLFSLISVYIISEDFGRWTFEPLRRWRTWLTSLLFGAVASMILAFSFLIVRIMAGGVMSLLTVPGDLILLTMFFIILAGLMAFVAGVGAHLFIRVAAGIKGGVPLSKIVTEDFGHWTLRSLLHRRAWRNVLQSGLEGGVAGLFVVSTILLIGMLVFFIFISYVVVRGSAATPELAELVAGLFVALMIIVFGFIGFPFGFIFGILLGILRICRETARFVNIHSPYQRLRAGIIFNILQLVVVGWCFYFLNHVHKLPNYWRSSTEFHVSSLFPPTFLLFLIFGLIGLFRTPLLKHLTLRVCMTLEGAMPLRYAGFLDYAKDLGVLERDRGQWRFRHQILQDYFAQSFKKGGRGFAQL